MKEKFGFDHIPVKGIEQGKETTELVEFFKHKNYYERLGVSPKTSKEDVEKVFSVLRIKYPYEKFPQVFMMLHEAAALLTDPKHRGRYNKEIGISDPDYPYSPDPKAEFYRKKHRMFLAREQDMSRLVGEGDKTKEAIYYETLLNFKYHVILKLSFSISSITQIKAEIMDLVKDGFVMEDVLAFVDAAAKDYFFEEVNEIITLLNSKGHKDLEFHMEGIIHILSALETLGVERLSIIDPTLTSFFVYLDEFIEFKIKELDLSSVKDISKLIAYLEKIGLSIEDIKENILRANYRLSNRELLYNYLF